MQKPRLDLTGLAKPGKTRKLIGAGPGLDHHDPAGSEFGRVRNRTEQILRS